MKKVSILFLIFCFMLSSMAMLTSCGKKNKKVDDDSSSTSNTTDNIEPSHTHNFYIQSNADKYLASPATCSSKAKYYKSCECGEKSSETFEFGEVNPNAHSFKESDWVAEVAPTAQSNGTKGHYYCEYCDKYFDKDLNVIDNINIIIMAHHFNYKGECTDSDCDINILNSFTFVTNVSKTGECNAIDGYTGIHLDNCPSENISLSIKFDERITSETKALLDVKAYDKDGNELTISYNFEEWYFNNFLDESYGLQQWRVEQSSGGEIYFIIQLAYNSSFEFILEYYRDDYFGEIVINASQIVK